MIYNSFKYSFKIWATSVLVAPALLFIIHTLKSRIGAATDQAGLDYPTGDNYFAFVIFGGLFSVITWLVFTFAIWVCGELIIHVSVRTLVISLLGIVLTVSTFLLMIPPGHLWHFSDEFVVLMYCNCLCIGVGSWLYQPKPASPLDGVETASPEY